MLFRSRTSWRRWRSTRWRYCGATWRPRATPDATKAQRHPDASFSRHAADATPFAEPGAELGAPSGATRRKTLSRNPGRAHRCRTTHEKPARRQCLRAGCVMPGAAAHSRHTRIRKKSLPKQRLFLVGETGFEPATSNSRSWRANRTALHPERRPL